MRREREREEGRNVGGNSTIECYLLVYNIDVVFMIYVMAFQ
jgi:hypothetical protein